MTPFAALANGQPVCNMKLIVWLLLAAFDILSEWWALLQASRWRPRHMLSRLYCSGVTCIVESRTLRPLTRAQSSKQS
jgi:hypothetical protein